MTTIENNKLIAEFMGGLFNKHSNKYGIGNAEYITIGKLNNVVKAINHYDIVDLKYHNNWNWLMEVVEKIESLSEEQKVINFSRQNKSIFDFKLTESKIEATYNACIEFIKWYNENNPIN
jgi:DNA replication protein DnaC